MGFVRDSQGAWPVEVAEATADRPCESKVRLLTLAFAFGMTLAACKTTKASRASGKATTQGRTEQVALPSSQQRGVEATPSSPAVASARNLAPPPPERCQRPTSIADFENGSPTVCAFGGRGGPIVIYSDGTGVVTPSPGSLLEPYTLAEPRGSSHGALRLVGRGHLVYGVGVAAHLASGMTVDVSQYRGVEGYFRSTRPLTIHIKLATRQTMAEAYGGACQPADDRPCNDHHGVERTVGPSWQRLRAPIAELRQLETGVRAAFDATQVMEVHVRVPKPAGPDPLDFELLVDDLAFY